MRRIFQVTAILSALSAFPALAGENAPAPGSAQDPFSQTYTGKEQEPPKPCDRSCSCGHHGAKDAARKAEAPRFTDAG